MNTSTPKHGRTGDVAAASTPFHSPQLTVRYQYLFSSQTATCVKDRKKIQNPQTRKINQIGYP